MFIAGGFFVLGYLIINQVMLRVMVLIGTGFYVLYYATVGAAPLWDAIYASLIMGVANIIGLLGLLARRSPLAVPRAHRDIYPRFHDVPPGDFRTLMRLGQRYTVSERVRVTNESAPGRKLFYIIKGHAQAQKNGRRFTLPSHIFIGEVAFLTGRNSSATVWLEAGAEVIEWQSADLRAAAARRMRFKLALEAAISLDLAHKVAAAILPVTPDLPPELAFATAPLATMANHQSPR